MVCFVFYSLDTPRLREFGTQTVYMPMPSKMFNSEALIAYMPEASAS